MALSKCGSCNGGFFQLVEKEPSGSNFKVMFVQCSACGVPIGVMDYFDTHTQIQKLDKRLNNLQSAVDTIDHNLRVLISNLR